MKFIKNKYVINIALIGLFYLLVLIAVILGIRMYTHHGEKLEMPDLVGKSYDEATKLCKEKTFVTIVEDSIFKVGMPGGIVLTQNPSAQSYVKEKRKVYVTLSKYAADLITVAQLPILYGRDFQRKQNELQNSFFINCEIEGYEYDQGEPDQILRVLYKGDEIINADRRRDEIKIEKGATLKFILSKSTDGLIYMPDVRCKRYDEAQFQITHLSLYIDESSLNELDINPSEAYIFEQYPPAGQTVYTGDTVQLFLSANKPNDCSELEGN